MVSYFDKVLYLYPNIQNVMYWHTQYTGEPWNDPYDGLEWNNTEIPKPSKEELDALNDLIVEVELKRREEVGRKEYRNKQYSKNLVLVSNYQNWKILNTDKTFPQYLDYLESIQLE
jgi:hypothetical protein